MPKNTIFQNEVSLTGYVFATKLRQGTTGATNQWHPNENYISGTIEVATDDDALTVVPVSFFAYEFRNNKDGHRVSNETYQTLSQVIDAQTYERVGTNAMKLRISGSIDTNDFYSSRNDQIVSSQRINGRFVHIDTSRGVVPTMFNANMVVCNVAEMEQEGRDEYVKVGGYVFNYNGSRVYPVSFECHDAAGKDFILSLDASTGNPVSLNVWGTIESTVIAKPTVEQEAVASGFGVRPVMTADNARTVRSWKVTGADANGCPEFEAVAPFTKKDMKRLIDERNTRLQEIEQKDKARMAGNALPVKKNVFAPAVSPGASVYDEDMPF